MVHKSDLLCSAEERKRAGSHHVACQQIETRQVVREHKDVLQTTQRQGMQTVNKRSADWIVKRKGRPYCKETGQADRENKGCRTAKRKDRQTDKKEVCPTVKRKDRQTDKKEGGQAAKKVKRGRLGGQARKQAPWQAKRKGSI
jgi:hypothetical protein